MIVFLRPMEPARPIKYMPQIDAIRAFAVFLVIISHWLPKTSPLNFFQNGIIGVDIFFVLSGFLITQILLKNKEEMQGKGELVKKFYIRRFFRIFPIYYLIVFICFFLNVEGIQDRIEWYLLYISNFFMLKQGGWDNPFSHLWSLSVEEQFYIVWPFIILFTPNKHLFKVFIIFILLGPISRLLVGLYFHGFSYRLFTASAFDCFGLGGLLAFRRDFKISIFFLSLSIGVFLLLSLITLPKDLKFIHIAFFELSIAIMATWLIKKASIGFTGALKPILENEALVFIGKISYGLYIIHPFIPYAYKKLELPTLGNLYFMFPVYLAILLVLASLSWFVFEKPINKLKDKFTYNTP